MYLQHRHLAHHRSHCRCIPSKRYLTSTTTTAAAAATGFFIRVLVLIFILEVGSLAFALISFAFQRPGFTEGYTGWSLDTLTENLTPHFTDGETVQSVFAVFFPAIAGIMGGANMSGDLARPSYSIPKGTLYAIVTASILYVVLSMLMPSTTCHACCRVYSCFVAHCICCVCVCVCLLVVTMASTTTYTALQDYSIMQVCVQSSFTGVSLDLYSRAVYVSDYSV
jgi:hypothetical protein